MTNQTEAAKDRHWQLLFDVRRSARYHMRRQAFFELWHRLNSGINVLAGTTAVASLLTQVGSQHPTLPIAATLVISVFSAVDLVVGLSTNAHRHSDLRARFIELEKKLALKDELSIEEHGSLTAERLSIEAAEPPVLRALDTLCHNDLVYALRLDDKYKNPVCWYKRLTAHLINWDCTPKTTAA